MPILLHSTEIAWLSACQALEHHRSSVRAAATTHACQFQFVVGEFPVLSSRFCGQLFQAARVHWRHQGKPCKVRSPQQQHRQPKQRGENVVQSQGTSFLCRPNGRMRAVRNAQCGRPCTGIARQFRLACTNGLCDQFKTWRSAVHFQRRVSRTSRSAAAAISQKPLDHAIFKTVKCDHSKPPAGF